ncbi:TPA: DUF4238 domain-containing protein [Pseudomonas aeruginosa]|nr:DUF4238 domain-containing protein [Pseudomonas aeruginosa]HEP9722491.1 DUF4238 domain-containing protein [Pseudomonas aeruginosa]
MQQLRKDNHYVPKLYLKQWATGGMIPTYRLLVPSENIPLWRTQSLKGIAYHQHLYTYLAGHEETDEFERWLDSEFEGPAEEPIRRAVLGERLLPEHWKRLERFAMALDVRTPASLRSFLKRQKATLQDLMEETMERSISTLEDLIRRNEPLPTRSDAPFDAGLFKVRVERLPDGSGQVRAETIIGRRLWLDQMRRTLTETIHKLPALKWTILHSPSGMAWPTTDNPLVKLNFEDRNSYDFGGGWGVKNGDILLPLSPKHLLYTCIGRRSWPRGTTADIDTARLIQKIIIEHADRYVFAKEPFDVQWIRKRLVCPLTFKSEIEAWQNWHSDQIQAERELQQ